MPPCLSVFRLHAQTRLVGSLSLCAALVVYAMALDALRRDQTTGSLSDDQRTWWFGYARDLTNVLGLTLIALSHYLLGFSAHLALLAGFLTALVLYVLDYALARVLRWTRSLWVLIGLMLVITLPTQIVPHTVARLLGGVLATLIH